jgi:hypothetical protein
MIRKPSNIKSSFTQLATTTKNRTKSIPILPPSPKVINEIPIMNESVELNKQTKIQNSNAIFDPNNASPASEFMDLLKLRMSIYYDHEIDMILNSNR